MAAFGQQSQWRRVPFLRPSAEVLCRTSARSGSGPKYQEEASPPRNLGAFMSGLWGAVVCATALWVIVIATAYFELVKRPAGEAWVVTASEKMPSRPALVRAHVPFKTAAGQ